MLSVPTDPPPIKGIVWPVHEHVWVTVTSYDEATEELTGVLSSIPVFFELPDDCTCHFKREEIEDVAEEVKICTN